GIIGFLGLIVPHAVRLVFGEDHRKTLPLTLIGGATLLIAVDLVARTAIQPQEVPVGILTAILGGPFFIMLLRRRRVTL
ncbi:MAG: iron chelate uptake ABC transporter family permease subunit, partial [Dehalococcoidia bacterium]